MKIVKSMALIAVGALAVKMYETYSEPVFEKIGDFACDTMKKANKKLDDMID